MIRNKNFKTLSIEEWQSFNTSYPAPTFQAGPAWSLALHADNAGCVPEPLTFQMRDGSTMIVPMIRATGGRLRWRAYCGFPLDGFNVIFRADGVVAEGKILSAALDRLAELNIDRLELTLWPFLHAEAPAAFAVKRYEASTIDLRDGADAAIARMDGRTRRMAGQALRRGVTCLEKTDSQSVSYYYDLLLQSAKRWGRATPTVSKRFVEALVQHGGKDAQIWLALFEGKPVAGLIALYGTSEVNIWSAAMDSDFAVLRPHNMLHLTLLKAAEARGVRWYNLGSSEGLPGVKKFKDGLGAQTIGYNCLTLEKGLYKLYSRIRNRGASLIP